MESLELVQDRVVLVTLAVRCSRHLLVAAQVHRARGHRLIDLHLRVVELPGGILLGVQGGDLEELAADHLVLIGGPVLLVLCLPPEALSLHSLKIRVIR